MSLSPSASITKRKVKGGTRYVVRFRFGGSRYEQPKHAGSFKNRRDAEARERYCISELVAGRDPREAVHAGAQAHLNRTTIAERWDAFVASCVDVGADTIKQYGSRRRWWETRLSFDRDLESITTDDVQAVIAAAKEELRPGTLRLYVSTLAQVFDHAKVRPNPCRRAEGLRLPSEDAEEVEPPKQAEFAAMLAGVPTGMKNREMIVLALELCEGLGLRGKEVLSFRHGDVNWTDGTLLIAKSSTKGRAGRRRSRVLPIPPRLLEKLEVACSLTDRQEARDRPVFTGITHNALQRAMEKGAAAAGVPHSSPHKLRHRRVSLWLAHGIDPVRVKTWAGHTKAAMSLDVYGHVLPSLDDQDVSFWLGAYRQTGLPALANGGE